MRTMTPKRRYFLERSFCRRAKMRPSDLTQALHTIFLQPSLPPFISRQLIQHLVTSNPSPAYVERVASVFANNGSWRAGRLESRSGGDIDRPGGARRG